MNATLPNLSLALLGQLGGAAPAPAAPKADSAAFDDALASVIDEDADAANDDDSDAATLALTPPPVPPPLHDLSRFVLPPVELPSADGSSDAPKATAVDAKIGALGADAEELVGEVELGASKEGSFEPAKAKLGDEVALAPRMDTPTAKPGKLLATDGPAKPSTKLETATAAPTAPAKSDGAAPTAKRDGAAPTAPAKSDGADAPAKRDGAAPNAPAKSDGADAPAKREGADAPAKHDGADAPAKNADASSAATGVAVAPPVGDRVAAPKHDPNAPVAAGAPVVAQAVSPRAPLVPKPGRAEASEATTVRPPARALRKAGLSDAARDSVENKASNEAPSVFAVTPAAEVPTVTSTGAHVKTVTTADPTVTANAEDGKAAQAVRAAESLGHKRVLAAGEANGRIFVPELGRVEVRALTDEKSNVDVRVHVDDAQGRAVVASHAPELRAHVQAEVPQAQVTVERPHQQPQANSLAHQNTAGNMGSNDSRSGRGGGDPRGRDEGDATGEAPGRRPARGRARFVL